MPSAIVMHTMGRPSLHPGPRPHHRWLFYLLLALLAPEALGVMVHKVVVPEPGVAGRDVELECNWDVGAKGFYSVRWYKNNDQFYSYVPQNLPDIKMDHNLPGVSISLSHSDERKVTLRKIDLGSEGMYRCEVMSEGPTFETSYASAELMVVEMPETPQLSGLRERYTEGDTLRVNCTARNGRPPAHISFFVNSKYIHPESGRVYESPAMDGDGGGDQDRFGLSTSRSTLVLPLGRRHVPSVIVECRASIMTEHVQTAVTAFVDQQTSFSLFSQGARNANTPHLLLLTAATVALAHFLAT